MIEIYPNRLDGAPCETHTTDRRWTIAGWIDNVCKLPYASDERLPLDVAINGELIPFEEWALREFVPADHVEMWVQPRGTDPFSITYALFAGVKAVFSALIPALPGQPSQPGQGESLANASARGNKVRLGDVVRDAAGFTKIWPDYLVPPHKYYAGPREQWTEMLLNIGVGQFQILAGNVRIGDTPLLALGDQAEYQIFQPGESVYGNTASHWWHQAQEVGASSTGMAGLELEFSTAVTPSPSAGTFQFNGYTITIPTGQGEWPSDWGVGLVLRVLAPYTYTVTDGGGSARDVISGPLHMLDPSPGDLIEVAGANAGRYEVVTYTPGTPGQMTLDYEWGDPANDLQLGSGSAAIGPDGLRFRITSKTGQTITVERLDSAGGVDTDFPGFDPLTSSSAQITVDVTVGEGGWRGPFPAVPEGEVTNTLELDFFFPQGLCIINKYGNPANQEATWEIEYRAAGSDDAWTVVPVSRTNATMDQIGYTITVNLPSPMRPEVRVRKTGPASNETAIRADIQWYALKGRIDRAPVTYPGWTTIAIKIQTSDRISAQSESLVNVRAERILPERDLVGGWGAPVPTRNIAAWVAYVARSLGYTDERIDLEELDRLDSIWRERGDYFDHPYVSESTGQQVINDALAAGFAEITTDRGRLRPVRDEPRSVFEHMYTPQNMTSRLLRDTQIARGPDEFDGVEVTYTDPNTWAEAVVMAELPGDARNKVQKITAVGITDRTRAWRMGMRRRRAMRFRNDAFQFSTELDALNSRYWSYCAVADDVPGYGQSAILRGLETIDGNLVMTSGEPFDWSAGGSHVVALRRQDGTVCGPFAATRINDFTLSIVGDPLDFDPVITPFGGIEPTHMLFGPIERWSYPVLISSIEPSGLESASVSAVNYAPEVYLDDNGSPP